MKAKQRLVKPLSDVKLLTIAVIVENHAKNVDECSLNQGHQVLFGIANAVRYTE